MRFRVLATVWFAVCGAMPLLAQALPPTPSAPVPAQPHSRAKTAPPAPSPPQAIFDATSLGSPLQLQSNWRVGITSDPSASSPSFDDSNWAIRNAQAFISDVPDEENEGSAPAVQNGSGSTAKPAANTGSQRYAWFRLHIKLAPNHGPVALLIELPVSTNTSFGLGSTGPSPDIYANGRHIQPEGPHGDAPQRYQLISRIYDLNVPASETSLTLVVRVLYLSTGYGAYTTFFANRTFYLGNPGDLARELNLWSNRSLFERLPRLIYCVLLALLAIFLFALYLTQRDRTEYLWLALHELAQAPLGFIELAGSSARIDTLWYAALVLELILVSAYLFFEFLVVFLALPRPWYTRWLRYTAPALAAIGPALLGVGHSTTVAILLVGVLLFSIVWVLGWFIFVFITLFAAAVRRNLEAGLWLIPLILSVIGIIEPIMTSVISDETGVIYRSPLTIDAGPIPIHMSSVGDFAGILVILLIIYFRFMRVYRDQERSASELAAARSVQELLIPREKIATPGFEVDAVYTPATEVGGDFFHLQSAGLDGMLVVIGDVAGKGLKAAMNVSLLIGALRRTHERSPAKILESLNSVLTGTESFTTCQAIWLASNGEMVIANAGHLSPYLNSQEINLPGALPLGVIPQVTYEEERFYLHPGDRILLLSDGVVEARKSSGELFGFDRVRFLSNQSAFYLADAAKAFGQEDDITVLTVRRQVQAVLAA
ncbi:MAG: SpoIIE family protein phosphatase [Terracidiphilus sp.]